jgi:hypothetical protein
LVATVAGALLAGCVPGAVTDFCTGEACNNTRLELVVDSDDSRACTMLLATPQGTSLTAHANVRLALQRQGQQLAISAVRSSGGALPAVLGEIGVPEGEANAVEVVHVECFDESGTAIEYAGASLRRVAP